MLSLDTHPEHEVWPGFRGRLVHTDNASLVWWSAAAGATVPDHSHPQEQVVNMIDGEFDLVVNGVTHHMTAGTVVVIPGGTTHSARALTDCRLLDVFTPVREDYRQRFG